jgi:SAM-dependent methyltransferase
VNLLLALLTDTLSALLGAITGLQLALRATNHAHPRPWPAQAASLLEHPLRRQILAPVDLLGLCGVTATMQILDAGCGAGVLAVEAARMLLPPGKLIAVDCQPGMIEQARRRIAASGLTDRVTLHQVGLHQLPLAAESVDLVLLVSTLGEVSDKAATLAELRRVLRPEGRLLVTEELLSPGYLTPGSVRRWAEDAGFRFGAQSGSPLACHQIFFPAK